MKLSQAPNATHHSLPYCEIKILTVVKPRKTHLRAPTFSLLSKLRKTEAIAKSDRNIIGNKSKTYINYFVFYR